MYVVLNAATAEGTSGNSFYGLAIGMTVMTGAFSVGDISGGAFNPAIALAISVIGIASWSNLWIYLVVEFAAAAHRGCGLQPDQSTGASRTYPNRRAALQDALVLTDSKTLQFLERWSRSRSRPCQSEHRLRCPCLLEFFRCVDLICDTRNPSARKAVP